MDVDGPSFLFSLSDGTVKGITGDRVMVVRRREEGRVVQAIVGDGLDGGVFLSFIDMLDEGIMGELVMVVGCGGEGRVVWAIVGDGSDGGVISSSIDMLLGRSFSVS